MKTHLKFNSIRWRLPISYAAIALLAALSLGSVMLLVLSGYYARQEREYLYANITSLQPIVENMLGTGASPDTIYSTIQGLAFFSQTRIRILDPEGEMMVDTGEPSLDQQVSISGSLPDTYIFSIQSEAGGISTGGLTDVTVCDPPGEFCPVAEAQDVITLSSSPVGYGFVAATPTTVSEISPSRRSRQVVSLPLRGSLGTLEISSGPAYGLDIIRSVSIAWAGAGLVAVLLAALAGWFASRQVTRPVLTLTDVTQRMESGDLSVRVNLPEKKPATEFQVLAHSFNGMAQRVEDTVSTLRAFVADAAHELHTPLTALHTNLELAADESDPANRTLYLARAQEQDQRLEGLVGGLLNLSRIEAAGKPSDTVLLDFNSLVLEIGEQFAPRAELSARTFTFDLPAEPAYIRADESQVRRILTNLLDNALKFTAADGAITLRLSIQGERAVLSVTDTGIGVPPEDLPHLFERFHRGRNASRYAGSGLGLAIVKALVDVQGGSVRAESVLGAGTSMTVEFPLAGTTSK